MKISLAPRTIVHLLSLGIFATALVAARPLAAQVTATAQQTLAQTLGNGTGVAVDALGNVYVADGVKNNVLQMPGGNGTLATVLSGLTSPSQVAFDNSRNLYIATGTQVMEIPYKSGVLNTSAPISIGTGLGAVTGVAVDASGNVFIADGGHKQIVKVSNGSQTTVLSGLTSPKQIAVDRLGNLFVADSGANAVLYVASGATTGTAIGTGLIAPAGVAVDGSNNIYIADTGNGRVVTVPSVSGVPTTASQTTLTSSVGNPTAIASDPRGTLYITAGANLYRFNKGAIFMGLLPVGTKSTMMPVTLNFTTALAPAAIKVVTTGLTGLDFNDAGASTCTAPTYALGNSCVVNVSFTPGGVGPRYGAIVLYDATNKVLGRVFLGGGGSGALITVDPGVATLVAPAVNSATFPSLTSVRGVTSDAAGNVFLAENGNTTTGKPSRVIYLPAGQTTATVINTATSYGIAIDGAGDLIVANGASTITLYPYENGTWNAADISTIATGLSKVRTAKFDVLGNIFYCDSGTTKFYKAGIGVAATALPYTTYATGCTGTAVDLYGNLAFSDSTAGALLYVPVNGATPYETGSGFTAAWGVAFDASGSVWITASTAAVLARIPNEYGTLVGADQVLSTAGSLKDFDIWLDNASGNLYVTQNSSTVTSFGVVARQADSYAFASTTAIGATNANTFSPFLSNSGASDVTFSNGGLVGYYSSADFPIKTGATSACDFTSKLSSGFACGLSFAFIPTSSGARAAQFTISSNAVANPSISLTGTGGSGATGVVTLGLSASPATPGLNQAVTITATLSAAAGTPTGKVTLSLDGTPISQQTAAGTLTFPFPNGISAGFHTAVATYSGDATFASATTSLFVSAAGSTPSSTTITASASTLPVSIATQLTTLPLVLTAKVTGTAGGAVPGGGFIFFDNGAVVGTATITAGTATFSYIGLGLGTHSITANYAGDATYATSISTPTVVTIVYPGDYTLTTSVPSVNVTVGTPTSVTITATPATGALGGFYSGLIGLTCSGLPSNSSCSVSPNTLSLDGTGTASSSTFTIITTSSFPQNVSLQTSKVVALCFLPAGLLLLSLRRYKWSIKLLSLLLLAGTLSAGVGCGSHAPIATSAGTYTVTISGAGSGNINHSVSFQLVVKN